MTNCYLLETEKAAIVIDPAFKREKLVDFLKKNEHKERLILITHGHFDHIYGLAALTKIYNVPVYMDSKETYSFEHTNPYVCGNYGLPLPQLPDYSRHQEGSSPFKDVKDGDIIKVGDLRFEVLQTPGHSVGGLCFLERESKILFSGDTLFAGAIGRTDHPGGDYDLMMKSIWEKIMCLDGDISVIPGHGPETDIATERMTNPFLLPFNEPYEE